MRKNHVKIITLAFALQIVLPDAGGQAVARAGKAAYPAMAPPGSVLISDEKSEIALGRSCCTQFHTGSNGSTVTGLHSSSSNGKRQVGLRTQITMLHGWCQRPGSEAGGTESLHFKHPVGKNHAESCPSSISRRQSAQN